MLQLKKIFFCILILNGIFVTSNFAAISRNFPSAKVSFSERQNNSRQFRTLKHMARLENILEGDKKSSFRTILFLSIVALVVIVGAYFLLAGAEVSIGGVYLSGFYGLLPIVILAFLVAFGIYYVLNHKKAKTKT